MPSIGTPGEPGAPSDGRQPASASSATRRRAVRGRLRIPRVIGTPSSPVKPVHYARARMIDVVDYRAGNAPSVMYALEHLGLPCRLVGTPEAVGRSERLILPGVGAARATLASLEEQGLVDALSARVRRRRRAVPRYLHRPPGALRAQRGGRYALPRLGAGHGTAVPARSPRAADRVERGAVRARPRRHERVTGERPLLLRELLLLHATDPDDVLGITDYGDEFCSVVARENIVATQFHAEKSGPLGLALLRGFAQWDATC